MQPSLLAVQNATSTSLLSIGISQPSQLEAGVTESSEEPVSDPLALEEPAPALTFQTASPSSFTPSDTSAIANHQLVNTPAKKPRMMSSGFQASPNPGTPPGPRVWKSPAPTPSQQSVTSRLETSRYRDFSQFFESIGPGLENFGLKKSLGIGLENI